MRRFTLLTLFISFSAAGMPTGLPSSPLHAQNRDVILEMNSSGDLLIVKPVTSQIRGGLQKLLFIRGPKAMGYNLKVGEVEDLFEMDGDFFAITRTGDVHALHRIEVERRVDSRRLLNTAVMSGALFAGAIAGFQYLTQEYTTLGEALTFAVVFGGIRAGILTLGQRHIDLVTRFQLIARTDAHVLRAEKVFEDNGRLRDVLLFTDTDGSIRSVKKIVRDWQCQRELKPEA